MSFCLQPAFLPRGVRGALGEISTISEVGVGMAASPQLRLVQDAPPAHGVTQDPVRQVFEHWVFMFGKQPGRTKLDAERRQVIQAALQLYEWDVQTVMLAVEGMAAVPLGDKPEGMQDAMREVTWFLAKSSRIESALRWSDRLRLQAAQQQAMQCAVPVAPEVATTPEDAAAARAARERLRELAQQGRQGQWRHG